MIVKKIQLLYNRYLYFFHHKYIYYLNSTFYLFFTKILNIFCTSLKFFCPLFCSLLSILSFVIKESLTNQFYFLYYYLSITLYLDEPYHKYLEMESFNQIHFYNAHPQKLLVNGPQYHKNVDILEDDHTLIRIFCCKTYTEMYSQCLLILDYQLTIDIQTNLHCTLFFHNFLIIILSFHRIDL